VKGQKMKNSHINKFCLAIAALSFVVLAMAPAARAENSVTVQITLKDHRFAPAEPHAPAGKPITIIVKNLKAICCALRKS
jgi:ABC-type amino acid transport substrate-binding protein